MGWVALAQLLLAAVGAALAVLASSVLLALIVGGLMRMVVPPLTGGAWNLRLPGGPHPVSRAPEVNPIANQRADGKFCELTLAAALNNRQELPVTWSRGRKSSSCH